MNYTLEQNLVEDFVRCIPSSPFSEFGAFTLSREFEYQRGRTDIILLTYENEVIAFEAKLRKWREALYQAYRNTCFAQYSYVVLNEGTAKNAIKHYDEFVERNIGICYIHDNEIKIIQKANRIKPLQYWLYDRARIELIKGGINVAYCNAF